MKKMISILLLVSVLCLLFVVPSSAESYAWVKTGNGKSLNMREEPDKNSTVVRTLPYRTKVIVYEYTNGWALVEPADFSMSNPKYVAANFLVSSDPGPYQGSSGGGGSSSGSSYPEMDTVLKTMRVLSVPYRAFIKTSRPTNYVHLRWVPDTNAAFIDKYLCNTEVLVLSESTYWAQVQVVETGYVGFVLKSTLDAAPADGSEG